MNLTAFLNKVRVYINRNIDRLFLLSFSLILIPPLYLLPGLGLSIVTTHTLARLIILLVFIDTILYGKSKLNKSQNQLIIIFLIYFLFQSVSILGANNIVGYFQRYKDIVMPGLFLFVFFRTKIKYKTWFRWTLLIVLVNFVYQMLLFFTPETFKRLGSIFLYSKHYELVLINVNRGRIFIETFGEVMIPILFVVLSLSRDLGKKLLGGLGITSLLITSVLSNFRSRILMMVLAFIGSVFLLKLSNKLKIGFLMLSLLTFIIVTGLSSRFFGFSLIDRLLFTDEQEDVATIDFRLNNASRSLEMGEQFPWYGIGLGNYFDNLPPSKMERLSYFEWRNVESRIASSNPHSIISQLASETGFLSLAFFMAISFYFGIKDLLSFWGSNVERRAWIIGFWSLYSFSLFNPTTTMTYNTLFWVLRGLIYL